MYKTITYFFFLLSFFSGHSQFIIKVEKDINNADYSIKIGDEISYPDIRVKIGENVSFENFTVGITSNKSQANFIITDGKFPDWTVRADNNISYPDLKISAGDKLSYADVTIELKRDGTVDYLVYTEKLTLSIEEIVVAVLPAINKFLEYKYEKIPRIK